MKNYIVFFTLVLNVTFVACNKNDSLPIEHPKTANTNTISCITKVPSANEYYVSLMMLGNSLMQYVLGRPLK